MSDKKWQFRITHILDAVGRIRQYTDGLSREEFSADQKTIDAVTRNFEIIGEAARNVPVEVQRLHPDIPWSLMIGMRNLLAHDYEIVDADTLWQTIQDDLPAIIPPLQRLSE